MAAGTYKILNTSNDRFYIGSTSDFERRFTEHSRKLNTKKHDNPYLQNDWNKCGSDCFVFEVLDILPDSLRLEAEQELLDELWDKQDFCYNISREAEIPPSWQGKHLSPEHRSKISAACKGKRKPPRTAEHNAKLSASLKGKHLSPETRQKMSAARMGKGNPNFGKPMSPETRAKMSETQKKRWAERQALKAA